MAGPIGLFKSIALKNLLSYGGHPQKIELDSLNILIGANNSGKSNFLEAFHLLGKMTGDLDKADVESIPKNQLQKEPFKWIRKPYYLALALIPTFVLESPVSKGIEYGCR